MAMSSRERQRKWQERQRRKGMKRFTVVMTPEAYGVLLSEKNRTGEGFSTIVNRAVVQLKSLSGDNGIEASCLVWGNDFEDQPHVRDRIVSLMGIVGLNAREAADRLNEEQLHPEGAFGYWSPEMVAHIYRMESGV